MKTRGAAGFKADNRKLIEQQAGSKSAGNQVELSINKAADQP